MCFRYALNTDIGVEENAANVNNNSYFSCNYIADDVRLNRQGTICIPTKRRKL